MIIISFCNKTIEYSFYLMFFFVPLFFLGNTSELFEFNKMWLVFILTIFIGAAWVSKMIIEKKFVVRKTPLDIPIILFLISQIISTIFSLDTHVSFWGYYSRFNGGLLSIISYIFLYYAFVTNLEVKHALRVLIVSIASGIATVIWGFPSHFGFDLTCWVFRGVPDTNCWTDAFKPTIRAFSTLGQPAWFAAYLDVLIPLLMSYLLINIKQNKIKSFISLFLVMLFFYSCLIFANTRAAYVAFYIVDILFWAVLLFRKFFKFKTLLKYFLVIHIGFAICSFFFGAPIGALDKFTFPQLAKQFTVHAATVSPQPAKPTTIKLTGITDSAQIRLIVWKGAIQAWLASPIFGTGVETFAFAYYAHRPAEHNMTSEWDYLYNKAHNEYLNYLTTTGIFGLGTYLAIIVIFLFITVKFIFSGKESYQQFLLILALLSGYITILITNFFGFSVVIINLYFFLIPALVFFIADKLNDDKNYSYPANQTIKRLHLNINLYQWVLIIITLIIGGNMIFGLSRYWYADTLYALGTNLDHVSDYQQAFPLLDEAVSIVPNEPEYKDELAVNLGTIAGALYLQNDSRADQVAKKAIDLDNQIVADHPNNVIYWKNRLRIFYSLGNGDRKNQGKYYAEGIKALYKSYELAPTDAKITYNLGVILGQTGNIPEGIKFLEKTITLKPDYLDAYIALGLLYHQIAISPTSPEASSSAQGKIVNPEWQKKAVDIYNFVLKNLSPDNAQITKTLQSW